MMAINIHKKNDNGKITKHDYMRCLNLSREIGGNISFEVIEAK